MNPKNNLGSLNQREKRVLPKKILSDKSLKMRKHLIYGTIGATILGIAALTKVYISKIDHLDILPPKQNSKIAPLKVSNKILFANFQNFQRNQAPELEEKSMLQDEIEAYESKIIKNLNYCLNYDGYSAEVLKDKGGNKALRVRDQNGKIVSEFIKFADMDVWQGSDDDRDMVLESRLCDTIETIADYFCNNWDRQRDPEYPYHEKERKVSALMHFERCPLNEEIQDFVDSIFEDLKKSTVE